MKRLDFYDNDELWHVETPYPQADIDAERERCWLALDQARADRDVTGISRWMMRESALQRLEHLSRRLAGSAATREP